MTYKITEYFNETKETIVRNATDDEILDIEARKVKFVAIQAETKAKVKAKAAAQAKLAALGLTVEDLQALGL